MVKKVARQNLTMAYIAKLLQAERARLWRKVRKLQRFGFNTGMGTLEADSEGAWIYRDDLLAALARGKR